MKLVHLLRRFVSVVCFAVSALWQLALSLSGFLLGEFHWNAPDWLCAIQRQLAGLWQWARHRPKHAAGAVVALAMVASGGHYGWQWYKNLPEPHTVAYRVVAPGNTQYQLKPPVIDSLAVYFDESAAPLENINKTVTEGIALKPAMPGSWRWENDRSLRFTPAQDWPIAQQYEIQLDKKHLLASGTLLKEYSQTFSTTAFTATVESTEFYQDPADSSLKKMVTNIHFSHPVDESAFLQRITLTPGEGLRYRDAASKDQKPYTVTFDAVKLNAFVHSLPLATPLETVPSDV